MPLPSSVAEDGSKARDEEESLNEAEEDSKEEVPAPTVGSVNGREDGIEEIERGRIGIGTEIVGAGTVSNGEEAAVDEEEEGAPVARSCF